MTYSKEIIVVGRPGSGGGGMGGTSLQEANGDVLLDGVAFLRLD